MKKRRILGILSLVCIVGMLTGCQGKSDDTVNNDESAVVENSAVEEVVESVASESSEAETTDAGLTIRVGGCDFAIWNPQVNVAIHEGLFEKEFGPDNITIESYNFANGPAGNEAFAAGALDIFNGTGDQPFVNAIANTVPVVLLSTTGEQGRGNLVVVREDSGIRSPQDLAGKKIGVYIGTQQHKTWLQYLAGNGIDPEDVEFVNLQGFQEQYSAISKGDIDAFYASQYNYDAIESEGITNIGNLQDYPSRCYITARKEFVEENPEIVQRFFNVLYEAQEFIEANPDKTYEYLAEDSGLSVEEVQKTVEGFDLYLRLDEEIEAGIEDTYTFLREQGILETEIDDIYSHLDNSFVKN